MTPVTGLWVPFTFSRSIYLGLGCVVGFVLVRQVRDVDDAARERSH